MKSITALDIFYQVFRIYFYALRPCFTVLREFTIIHPSTVLPCNFILFLSNQMIWKNISFTEFLRQIGGIKFPHHCACGKARNLLSLKKYFVKSPTYLASNFFCENVLCQKSVRVNFRSVEKRKFFSVRSLYSKVL